MNRSKYTAFVKKIWTEPDKQNRRSLTIAGLGIIGECGEICEQLLLGNDGFVRIRENLIDECGDVLYYATVLADWKGFDVADIWPTIVSDPESRMVAGCVLVRDAKEVSERIKKLIRDGVDPNAKDIRNRLRTVLGSVARILAGVGANLHDAMNANVRKLETRYAHMLDDTDRSEFGLESEPDLEGHSGPIC